MPLSGDDLNKLVIESGPDAAFIALHGEYRTTVARLIRRSLPGIYCRNPQEHCEGVTQNFWLKVWNDLAKRYEEKTANYVYPAAWLKAIAFNACYEHIKKDIQKSRERGFETGEEFDNSVAESFQFRPGRENSIETDFETREAWECFEKWITQNLSQRDQAVIRLRLLGYSSKETGKHLSLSEANVRKIISRTIWRYKRDTGRSEDGGLK